MRTTPKPDAPGTFVDPASVVFPQAVAAADGALEADLPPGQWTVLRVGSVASGIRNHPAPDDATGWECDKLSAAGVDAHWDGFLEPLVANGGDLADGKLQCLLLDSWECQAQTWTPALDATFAERLGYPLDRWYPALAGYVTGSRDRTMRFLRD